VDLGSGRDRLGGSALATVFGQIGDTCADVEDPSALKRCFECVQQLLEMRVLAAGHDSI